MGIYRDGDEWVEYNEGYCDGLDRYGWIEENKDWLSAVAPQEEWPSIYDAFNASDWRYGQCGGCI